MTAQPWIATDIVPELDRAAALHAANFVRPWDKQALEDLLTVDGTAGLALVTGDTTAHRGEMVGFVLFRNLAGTAEILTLVVAERFRRQGAGFHLMTDALARLKEETANELFLEVQDGNHSAIALYESVGMEAFDRRRRYYRLPDGRHADAILMRLSLK